MVKKNIEYEVSFTELIALKNHLYNLEYRIPPSFDGDIVEIEGFGDHSKVGKIIPLDNKKYKIKITEAKTRTFVNDFLDLIDMPEPDFTYYD